MSQQLSRLPGRRVLEEIDECPGCGAGSWYQLRRDITAEDDAAQTLGLLEPGDEVRFELCRRCGLVFRAPRFSEDTLKRYYAVTCPANEPKTMPADRDSNSRYARRERARFARLARLVRRHCPRPSVVVDLGALDGASLRPYLDSGARGIAIEPGIDARRRADPRVETYPSFEALAADGVLPDVVLSTQTFEHLRSPRLAGNTALETMREGGVLVVEVPYDLLEMLFLIDPTRPVRAGHPEHINFFTSESIARMAAAWNGSVAEVSVGAQVHKYGGLIPSITLVARSGKHALVPRAERGATLDGLRLVLGRDRMLVQRAQKRLKLVGAFTRRGRW